MITEISQAAYNSNMEYFDHLLEENLREKIRIERMIHEFENNHVIKVTGK